jgi:hypothetical protein
LELGALRTVSHRPQRVNIGQNALAQGSRWDGNVHRAKVKLWTDGKEAALAWYLGVGFNSFCLRGFTVA